MNWLTAIMTVFGWIVRWSEKKDSRERSLIQFVDEVDHLIVRSNKFRHAYRRKVEEQLRRMDQLDAVAGEQPDDEENKK